MKNQTFEKLKINPGDIITLQMCTINDNHIMYGSWDIKCDRQKFLSFWNIFCPFTPLTQKIKILKKWKKKPGDITILHQCIINDNHLMYGSKDMKCEAQTLLSFWTIFLPFYYFNNPKNQNFEKLKKTPGDIINLYKCTKNHDHILYCSLDIMVHNRCNCYFSFWPIFCPFTSLTTSKIYKSEKKSGVIIILHKCTKNHDHML